MSSPTGRRIRVLIVDDSAFVRRLIASALASDPAIEVVGSAGDPYEAKDEILRLQPDVITLDLEMPRMDGLTFLRMIMDRRPMPVIIISSLTQRGSDYALEALNLGAFEVLAKPAGSNSFGHLGAQLAERIKATSQWKWQTPRAAATKLAQPLPRLPASSPRNLIVLGASTGGTKALADVITQLPEGLPGIAIVQHIPPVFSKAFAARLDGLSHITVREAVDGEPLLPGTALVAPGNFHLLVRWEAGRYVTKLSSSAQLWHQRPAVDALFTSVAECGAAPHVLAGIMTGMGRDGAHGLLRLRELGAATFAQDEASSVVYGMPRAAWENGGAQVQLSLDAIAPYLINHSWKKRDASERIATRS